VGPGQFLLGSGLPHRRQILASGCRVQAGEAIAKQSSQGALDAAAVSWTMGREEDGCALRSGWRDV